MSGAAGGFEREYRRTRQGVWKLPALIGFFFLLACLEVVISGVPLWIIPVLVAVLAASSGWQLLYAQRARTVVRPTGIAVHGALRVRQWAWHEIQDLRVETDPHARGAAASRRYAFLYDTAGRRNALPYVNDRVLPNLAAEVETLRGLLASHHGPA